MQNTITGSMAEVIAAAKAQGFTGVTSDELTWTMERFAEISQGFEFTYTLNADGWLDIMPTGDENLPNGVIGAYQLTKPRVKAAAQGNGVNRYVVSPYSYYGNSSRPRSWSVWDSEKAEWATDYIGDKEGAKFIADGWNKEGKE